MQQMKADALQGRTAIVTGAGSGIGAAVARTMAAHGAATVVADLRPEAAEKVAGEIKAAGGKAIGVGVDVADPASVEAMVGRAVQAFGALHILINNAGFQHVAPVAEFPIEQWNRMLAVLLTGPFLGSRFALPLMRAAGWGRIINIASIHGKVASPFKVGYISAKHGVLGLTRTVALETAAENITCNAICPGFVDTPLVRNQVPDLMKNFGVATPEEALERAIYSKTPQRRMLDADEVADLALFLCTDAARGVTGQAWNIDGGMVMY